VTSADLGRRELVHAGPHAALRPYVVGYEGYREHGLAPFVMREVPRGFTVLIVGFGPPFTVGLDDRAGLAAAPSHRSFLAGLHDLPALVRSTGQSCCLQVNLTPLGAARLLDATLGELAKRVVELDDALGRAARGLADRLREAGDWPSRFALLDAWLRARLAAAAPPPADLAWAWGQLRASGGKATVGALAASIACSRKHLSVRFRRAFGLPPKTLAQVLRFAEAIERLDREPFAPLAAVAAECGYNDQPHLNRDFRRFAGLTPTSYLERRLPPPGGLGEPR
jgi:AraC-like DNA-binding protein